MAVAVVATLSRCCCLIQVSARVLRDLLEAASRPGSTFEVRVAASLCCMCLQCLVPYMSPGLVRPVWELPPNPAAPSRCVVPLPCTACVLRVSPASNVSRVLLFMSCGSPCLLPYVPRVSLVVHGSFLAPWQHLTPYFIILTHACPLYLPTRAQTRLHHGACPHVYWVEWLAQIWKALSLTQWDQVPILSCLTRIPSYANARSCRWLR